MYNQGAIGVSLNYDSGPNPASGGLLTSHPWSHSTSKIHNNLTVVRLNSCHHAYTHLIFTDVRAQPFHRLRALVQLFCQRCCVAKFWILLVNVTHLFQTLSANSINLNVSCWPFSTDMLGVRIVERLNYSTVVQEVLGSNPGAAECVRQWWNYL